jgi:hypothetical protein
VLPALTRAARPLAKVALHGYFTLVDELKSLAADDEKKATPVLGELVTVGIGEVATVAGEEAVEAEVTNALVEVVVASLV